MSCRRLAATVALTAAILSGGCGGDDNQDGGRRPRTVTVQAQPQSPTPGVPGNRVQAQGSQSVVASNPFAPTSPWNQTAETAPVDPNSERYIRLASTRVGVIDRPGQKEVQTLVRQADKRLFINTTKWTTPVYDETNGQPLRVVCRQVICGPDAPGVQSVTVAADARPDPRFDGWMTVIDRRRGIAYDFWRARRVGDAMSYQYVKRWDLNGPGFSLPVERDPVRAVAARGSGLPLFAGLITPDELRAGVIDHALAISLPGPAQRRFVQPASVTDGLGRLNSIPEGARVRLRSDVRLGRIPGGANRRSAQAILSALKRYGAIVVDRSIVPTLYAQRNFDYRRTGVADQAADEGTTTGGTSTAPDGTATTQTTTDQASTTTTEPAGTPPPGARGDERNALLAGNELQFLSLDDFEVIRLGQIFNDPPLSRAFAGQPNGNTAGS